MRAVPDTLPPELVVDETFLGVDKSASFAGLFNPLYGADGPAATDKSIFSLSVTNGSDSGLVDTLSGNKVFLFNDGGVIHGRLGNADGTANAAGQVEFTITVDAKTGVVTLDQAHSLVHPDATNPDDAIGLSPKAGITLSDTVTDGDGDKAGAGVGGDHKGSVGGEEVGAGGGGEFQGLEVYVAEFSKGWKSDAV